MVKSKLITWLAKSCMDLRTEVLKPSSSRVTSYIPGARLGKRKIPFSLVTVVSWAITMAGDFNVTATPGRAKPSAVTTLPEMVPVCPDWAKATPASRRTNRKIRGLLLTDIPP